MNVPPWAASLSLSLSLCVSLSFSLSLTSYRQRTRQPRRDAAWIRVEFCYEFTANAIIVREDASLFSPISRVYSASPPRRGGWEWKTRGVCVCVCVCVCVGGGAHFQIYSETSQYARETVT